MAAAPGAGPWPAAGVRARCATAWSSSTTRPARPRSGRTRRAVARRRVRLRRLIADVDAYVPAAGRCDGACGDEHDERVHGHRTFPMLPERLSTDLTSLIAGDDRLCVVVEVRVDSAGRDRRARRVPRDRHNPRAARVRDGRCVAGRFGARACAARRDPRSRRADPPAERGRAALRTRRSAKGARARDGGAGAGLRGGELVDLDAVRRGPAREGFPTS